MTHTPLFDEHRRAGARIVDFHGWDMPVQYTSLVEEHKRVRSAVGLFDVSHMGEVEFKGPQALEAAGRLITNDLSALSDGRAVYSPMCRPDGGIVDDVIAYRMSAEHVFFCVNASNVDKDFAWMAGQSQGMDCTVTNRSAEFAQIAVQGPNAPELLARLFGPEVLSMPPFHHRWVEAGNRRMLLGTTGYTGEKGGELYCSQDDAPWLWRTLLARGEDLGVGPIGLGARDTLRLEMKYCLYGNDIDDTTTPIEANLAWTVKFTHPFNGREVMEAQKAAAPGRRLVGFTLVDKGVPRQGYPILSSTGVRVGTVTSGTMSPSLNQPIGLGYVDAPFHRVGAEILIDIRDKLRKAVVCATPFVKK
jgi:aminomethyltransferase